MTEKTKKKGDKYCYAGNGDKTRMSFERYLLSDLSVYPRVTGFTVVTPVVRSPLNTDAVEPVMKKPRNTLPTMWAKPMGA